MHNVLCFTRHKGRNSEKKALIFNNRASLVSMPAASGMQVRRRGLTAAIIMKNVVLYVAFLDKMIMLIMAI